MEETRTDFSRAFRPGIIKWLLAGAAGAFLVVYLLSSPLFIRPLYQSEALIYVPLTLFSQQYEQQGIGFGNNEEIDGHIQILKSSLLLDRLDNNFNLSSSWNIDTSSLEGKSRLYDRLNSLVKIQKTRYNSVSVRVRHHDRQLAASLANHIVSLGDTVKEEILYANRQEAFNFANSLYREKQQQVNELELLLADKGIPGLGQETRSGNSWRGGNTDLYSMKQLVMYEAELHQLSSLKNRFEILRKSLETPLPRSYVISPAVVSHAPVWPPRILLSSAAVATYIVLMVFFQILRQDEKSQQQ
jgi:capsular polysaccharide biosynthesis protein